ncbi:MAG: hypothetical protein J5621_05215 [Paludibacteraceae bacterium]|nr:hypothetical protein [Paludibacteraceae bacterium]
MKKILSLVTAMFCAGCLLAQKFGELQIPSVEHGIISVTRGDSALSSGDTVRVGETLTITYSATSPWFVVGDDTLSLTLTDEMISGGQIDLNLSSQGWDAITSENEYCSRATGWRISTLSYYDNPKTGDKTASVTTSFVGERKLSFMWNLDRDYVNWGNFILTCTVNGVEKVKHDMTGDLTHGCGDFFYDTISYVGTGNDEIKWICRRTGDYSGNQWGQGSSRNFYLDEVHIISGAFTAPTPELNRYYTITLPTMEHATISATLNGTAFTGGKALLGDELVITFTSTDPEHWHFTENDKGEVVRTIVLSESSFDSNEQLALTLPEMYELVPYQITLPELDHATVSATLNGSAFTGGEALLGDSLVLTYTSTDPEHWFFSRDSLDTVLVYTFVLSDYSFDKEGNLLIKMQPMYERKDYYVSIAPYAHMTFIVTQNGDTITGSHNLAHVDDEIEIYAHTDKGFYFMYIQDTIIRTHFTLVEDMFEEDSTYYLQVPGLYLEQPDITKIERIDSTSSLITWEGDFENYEIRVSTEEPRGDDRYWKGIHAVKGHEYLAENLIPGKEYLVLLRAVEDTIHSFWEDRYFTAGKGEPCWLDINLKSENSNGWYGAELVITEDGKSTSFTLENGTSNWEEYRTRGGDITITWKWGTRRSSYMPISFEIINEGNGNLVAEATAEDIYMFNDGEVLFEGYPCYDGCSPRIGEISYDVDETGTQYQIRWDATDAKAYDIVVTQDPYITEAQLDSMAVRRKAAAYSINSEKSFAFYRIYVRGICKSGEIGKWKKKLLYPTNSYPQNPMEIVENNILPIELDYHKEGTLMSDAFIDQGMVTMAYSFEVKDTTVISIRYTEDNQMGGRFYPTFVECYKYSNDSIKDKMFESMSTLTDSIPSGTYAVLVRTYNESLTGYTLDITLGGDSIAADSLVIIPIQLDTVISGDFTKAQDIVLHEMGNMPALAYTYSITPKDTVGVMLYLELANRTGGINLYEGQSMQLIASPGAGSPRTYTFYKDTTYYIQVATVPVMGGDKRDNFTLTVKRIVPDTTAKVIRPISTDTVIESQLTINDLDLLDGRYMHYYSFECTKETKMYMYVEKIEKEMPSNVSGGIVIGPGLASATVLELRKDSLTGDVTYSTSSSNSSFAPQTLGTDGDTIRYFITIFNTQSDEYRLVVRSEMDYDNPGGQLIEVGEHVKSKIDNEDGYSYTMAPGYSKVYRVQLEKGKKYAAIAYDAFDNKKTAPVNGSITPGTGVIIKLKSNLALFMMQPGAKNGSFGANVAYAATGSPDDWRAFCFTADTTAEYTFLVNAFSYGTQTHMDSVPFGFVINEYIDFDEYMQKMDTITGSLNEHGEMTNKDVKVRYDAHFQTPKSYITSEVGVYNVAGRAVEVPAGDTLFAQFALLDAKYCDAVMYVIDGNDTIKINYSGDMEEYSIVNDADTARVVYVIGTTYSFNIEDHNYSLRIGFGKKSMDPDTVVARPSVTSITVMYDATQATIQEKLLALDIEVYNSNDSLITVIPNSLEWWTIDLANNVATYEVNNDDLPLGYVFSNGIENVNVTINIKQPEVVVARASVDSIVVFEDATVDDIKALLAQISIAAYDSKNNVITTINTEVDLWTIDDSCSIATYELTNSVLPKYYTFKGEKATVTVSIVRKQRQGIEDVHGDDVQCTKVLREGSIYILRDGKVYSIMGQLAR